MSELFETIEKKADQKKTEAKNKAEAAKAAQEAQEFERKRAAKVKRKKAVTGMVMRLLASVLLATACWAAGEFNLIAEQLIVWLYAAVGSWLAFWFGAFVQFMWCKGGFMEC